MSFDQASQSFVGRVKNEATEPVCNLEIDVVVNGGSAQQGVVVPALDLRGRADFTIDAGTAAVTDWQILSDSATCTTVVSDAGEGAEGGHGSAEGGEGTAEGGEGSGHEGANGESAEGGNDAAEETSPTTPVSQRSTGTFNNLDYDIGFDQATNAFRGTVVNNGTATVCGSKLEIHMQSTTSQPQGQVIELGPTIPVDLPAGGSLDVVLSADPIAPDTYNLHPESEPC
jgi:hypothetical protein